MAILDELVTQIENPDLRARIAAEVEKLAKQKKFGLVFEEHLPECTPLWDIPVKKGSKVALKAGQVSDFYTVLKIEDGVATCLNKDKSATVQFNVDELVCVAEFGEPTTSRIRTRRLYQRTSSTWCRERSPKGVMRRRRQSAAPNTPANIRSADCWYAPNADPGCAGTFGRWAPARRWYHGDAQTGYRMAEPAAIHTM